MWDTLSVIAVVLSTIVIPYLGYIHTKVTKMENSLTEKTTLTEVEKLIDLKSKPNEILQQETARDVKEIKIKLDKIVEHMITSK